jgi:hypothetical protein
VALQAALCAAQCSFWHALLQYSTLLHALHVSKAPLGQPGHAQRRRSPAPDAPALQLQEAPPLVIAPLVVAPLVVAPLFVAPLVVAPLVVAPLSVEQAESVTGCGEIDMAETSAKSSFTERSSLSRSSLSRSSLSRSSLSRSSLSRSSFSRSVRSARSAVMVAASARVAPSSRFWPLCRSANLAALSAYASFNSSSLCLLKSRAKASLTRAPRTSAS